MPIYELQRAAKGKKGKRVKNAFRSRPGEPPHKQTGRLRGSVTYEVTEIRGRVGTNVEYGRHLELGTRKMAARPWLRRALSEVLQEIRAILTAPWNPT